MLAWTQSTWVAQEVERLNPGVQIELVGIETRGDRILDFPLSQIEGKEFFVAEIDQALQEGRVDFTVHSMKDLSLKRPDDLVCAAIPKRENPRDVIVFGSGLMDRLGQGATLRIGTSSPRRLENIPDFLTRALPRIEKERKPPAFEFIEIRGNVNTRLSRVQSQSDKPLDGVVLALAGLIRLWKSPAGRSELRKLFQGVRWMVLPLEYCPSAPAQGALAVECRAYDRDVLQKLTLLHDPETEKAVSQERSLLEEWGGGCHQRLGATIVTSSEFDCLFYIRGVRPNGELLHEVRWKVPQKISCLDIRPWDGTQLHPQFSALNPELPVLEGKAVFVAHSRAVQSVEPCSLLQSRVWTSGTQSWFKLAQQGIWVEGCSEGLGFEEMSRRLLKEAVLGLPPLTDWIVFTHKGAQGRWREMGKEGKNPSQVISTYQVHYDLRAEELVKFRQANSIFWSSGSQYQSLKEQVAQGVQHSCGPGKTASLLRQAGLLPMIFPSVMEWRKWLQIQHSI